MACSKGPRLSDLRSIDQKPNQNQHLPDSTIVSLDISQSCDMTCKSLQKTPQKNRVRKVEVNELLGLAKSKSNQYTPDFKKLAKKAVMQKQFPFNSQKKNIQSSVKTFSTGEDSPYYICSQKTLKNKRPQKGIQKCENVTSSSFDSSARI